MTTTKPVAAKPVAQSRKRTKPKNDVVTESVALKAAKKPKAARDGVLPFAKAFDLVLPKGMKVGHFTRKKLDKTVE